MHNSVRHWICVLRKVETQWDIAQSKAWGSHPVMWPLNRNGHLISWFGRPQKHKWAKWDWEATIDRYVLWLPPLQLPVWSQPPWHESLSVYFRWLNPHQSRNLFISSICVATREELYGRLESKSSYLGEPLNIVCDSLAAARMTSSTLALVIGMLATTCQGRSLGGKFRTSLGLAKVETLKLKISWMTNMFTKIINVIARATPGEQVTLIISLKLILI
jgi:hypothetical protein